MINVKSLRWKLFLLFVGLGLFISFGVGIVMYIEFKMYIKDSYTSVLQKALKAIDQKIPLVHEGIDSLKAEQETATDRYREAIQDIKYLTEAFNLEYIYFVTKTDGKYWMPLSSEYNVDGKDELVYSEPPAILDQAFRTGTAQMSSKPYTDEYGTFITALMPVTKNGQVIGFWGADYPYDYVSNKEKIALITLGGALFFSAALSGILAFRFSSYLIKPIREFRNMANTLAKRDFNITFKKQRNDELGEMQEALLLIRDNLKKAIDELQRHLLKIVANGKQLNAVIEESFDNTTLITDNMETMQKQSDTQFESVTRTAVSVEEIVKSIDSLNVAVQTQVSHIGASSSSIEKMVTNIDAIRSTMQNLKSIMDALSKSSAAGNTMLAKMAQEVKQIHEQSATLQNANKTISDIAAKTNLLAMNAAIEAAHAGETGKGFAVVAGEVRMLAELSSKESNGISDEVKKMEEGIALMTSVSNKTMETMEEIFTAIKNMGDAFSTVNNAVEEQAAGGSQILMALRSIQDATEQVRGGTKTIHDQSGLIHSEVETVQQISKNVATQSREVKSAGMNIVSHLKRAKEIAQSGKGDLQ
jgi:methyl-accepting chemotaxis protein